MRRPNLLVSQSGESTFLFDLPDVRRRQKRRNARRNLVNFSPDASNKRHQPDRSPRAVPAEREKLRLGCGG
jgi:hypothetical protein